MNKLRSAWRIIGGRLVQIWRRNVDTATIQIQCESRVDDVPLTQTELDCIHQAMLNVCHEMEKLGVYVRCQMWHNQENYIGRED